MASSSSLYFTNPKMTKRILFHDFFNPDAPPQEVDIRDEWPVKKVLSRRDVQNGQVIMPKHQFEEYILAQLHHEDQNWVNCRGYLRITVTDLDTMTECGLYLWKNASESYVFTEGWKNSFVIRRGLEVGAEVGFCWDQGLGELHFKVLSWPSVPIQE